MRKKDSQLREAPLDAVPGRRTYWCPPQIRPFMFSNQFLALKAKLKRYKHQGLTWQWYILIRAEENAEKILNKLFFLQCFDLFRVENEMFQLAQ